MEKLKYKDIKPFREERLMLQNNLCCLCKQYIKPEDAALDHDHVSGKVRGVLHKDCNILLGKIENFIFRQGKRLSLLNTIGLFMGNVVKYMYCKYEHMPLHPKHLTDKDKLLKKYRRLKKNSKKQETKDKYSQLIKELKSD